MDISGSPKEFWGRWAPWPITNEAFEPKGFYRHFTYPRYQIYQLAKFSFIFYFGK